MARRYAPLLCSIWDDPDFQALSEGAQRCYVMLLSQKKLSMVGVLPYTPRAWSRGCVHTDTAVIEAEVSELEARRFVVIDYATDELLVRTMVKHDPPKGCKSIAAMWRALDAVDSAELRRAVLPHVPRDAWTEPSVAVPAWARDDENAPSDGASDRSWPVDHGESYDLKNGASDGASDGGLDGARERARAATVPPATVPPSTSPSRHRPSTGTTVAAADDDDERTMRIAERIVAFRLEGKKVTNQGVYVRKVLESVITECTERIIELAGMFPDAPDTAIAAAVHTGETRGLAAYVPQPDNVIELPAPPPEWVRSRTKPKEAQ